MTYWLFQGNPKYYRVREAIKDFEQMPWLVTRYAKQIVVGDGVLVWIAGQDAGLYAIAEIAEPPQILDHKPDSAYWLDSSRASSDQPLAKIRFTHKLLNQPLLRRDLKQDPVLKDLLVIRTPNSTNFRVTPEQWQRVHELKG